MKSKILPITYLFTCGFTFFTASSLIYGVNPEELIGPDPEETQAIKQNQPLLKLKYKEDYILIKDRQNRTIKYYPGDTPTFVLKKLAYFVSNPTGEWHALAVHSWSLVPHDPLIAKKLQENPNTEYHYAIYQKNIPKEKRIMKKPFIKFKQEHTILTPHKSLSYLLVNLENNLKVKIDQIERDNKGQLILDDSTFIPYFDSGKPEEWNLSTTVLKDLHNQQLLHEKNTFYIRIAQHKNKKDQPIISLHKVTPEGDKAINIRDQINKYLGSMMKVKDEKQIALQPFVCQEKTFYVRITQLENDQPIWSFYVAEPGESIELGYQTDGGSVLQFIFDHHSWVDNGYLHLFLLDSSEVQCIKLDDIQNKKSDQQALFNYPKFAIIHKDGLKTKIDYPNIKVLGDEKWVYAEVPYTIFNGSKTVTRKKYIYYNSLYSSLHKGSIVSYERPVNKENLDSLFFNQFIAKFLKHLVNRPIHELNKEKLRKEELKYLQLLFKPQILDQLDKKKTIHQLIDLASDRSIYTNKFLHMFRDKSPFNLFDERRYGFVIFLKWTYDPETQNLILGGFGYLLPVEGKRINYPDEIDSLLSNSIRQG